MDFSKFEDIAYIVVFLAFVVGSWIKNLLAQKGQKEQLDEPEWDEPEWDEPVSETSHEALSDRWPAGEGALDPGPRAAPAATADPHAGERERLAGRFDALMTEADALFRDARVDRATARIAEVMADTIGPRASRARDGLTGQSGPVAASAYRELEDLSLIFGAAETFIRQRRVPGLRRALGDADAIARACYQPVLDFARVNLPRLTSADPVAVLTPCDLAIWTGFIPTGLAPLFLPRDFFADVRWWPALAHEMAHDFLAATGEAEDRLRDHLALPSESDGQMPLDLHGGGLSEDELYRVFGGWFEELFCDVLATLMLGPAYVYTMVEHCAVPDAPRRPFQVALDRSGRRYDVHPPGALRVAYSCDLLDRIGEDAAADEIRAHFRQLHDGQESIIFPVAGGAVGIPLEIVAHVAGDLVGQLCDDQLGGLDGHSLADIPGLEYGPHRAAEARRAASELLSGRAPTSHRALAVVAGAVLAWRQEPDRHDHILALARRAIVGVTETRQDLYSRAEAGAARPAETSGAVDLREAFVLHLVLSPPPPVARMRPTAAGFLSRRTWPANRGAATPGSLNARSRPGTPGRTRP